MCGKRIETWEHVWEVYRKGEGGEDNWQKKYEKISVEEGEGEKWMREEGEERKKEGSKRM